MSDLSRYEALLGHIERAGAFDPKAKAELDQLADALGMGAMERDGVHRAWVEATVSRHCLGDEDTAMLTSFLGISDYVPHVVKVNSFRAEARRALLGGDWGPAVKASVARAGERLPVEERDVIAKEEFDLYFAEHSKNHKYYELGDLRNAAWVMLGLDMKAADKLAKRDASSVVSSNQITEPSAPRASQGSPWPAILGMVTIGLCLFASPLGPILNACNKPKTSAELQQEQLEKVRVGIDGDTGTFTLGKIYNYTGRTISCSVRVYWVDSVGDIVWLGMVPITDLKTDETRAWTLDHDPALGEVKAAAIRVTFTD